MRWKFGTWDGPSTIKQKDHPLACCPIVSADIILFEPMLAREFDSTLLKKEVERQGYSESVISDLTVIELPLSDQFAFGKRRGFSAPVNSVTKLVSFESPAPNLSRATARTHDREGSI